MSIVNKPISLILLSFLFIPCIHSAYSATVDEYVGRWIGDVRVVSPNESETVHLTIKLVNNNGVINGTVTDNETVSPQSFYGNISNGVLNFQFPNMGPRDPDCSNWDVSATAPLAPGGDTMHLSAAGIICSQNGGEAGTFSGDLIKQKTSLQPILSILLKQNTPKFINGSFENYTNPTEYNSFPDIEDVNLNGWVANNTNSRLDVLVGPGYNASDGNSALRIYTTLDGATQTVSGFLPNHAYTLKFDMAATGYWNTSLNSWTHSADVGQGIDVKVDGISIGTATITSPFDTGATFGSSPFIYHAISINFIALKKELTFEFNILQNAQPTGVAIDNIMLTLIDS